MKLNFEYSMMVDYSEPVNKCCFTLKCLPKETLRQHLLNVNVFINPAANYSFVEEAYGNKKIIGSINSKHGHFEVTVSGSVEVNDCVEGKDCFEENAVYERTGMYRYPHGKTVMGACLKKYCDELKTKVMEGQPTDKEKAICLMNSLYGCYSYVPYSTDISTGCEEAFVSRKGVCQDYSHIYIAMCRYFGLPARYVTGLMIGEGKTHAWTEVLIDGCWVGFDVTNNCMIDGNYIKFADGRDAMDCKVNFGVIVGGGNQIQTVNAKVWSEE